MSAPHAPLFDPQHHRTHRTIPEWAASGPTENWWVNAVAAAVAHSEARVLLRMGNVLVVRYAGAGPLTVEELP